ncbi:HAD family hydrolase [Streptococcus dysgalactiae]|uniref:HAD family hydrolase n=1 Tax=Streptococcus dysgalactiae TaxID=1334 RepID=UPI002DD440D1|nr:HAD family hydrolase [Streptococcus dysgalactiae]
MAFDLMDTLIEPPSRESISKFLSSSPLFFELSEFQRKLFEIGFPYAPFINSLEEFNEQKELLLTIEQDNYLEHLSKRRYLQVKIYSEWFIKNCNLVEHGFELLDLIKKNGVKILIITNLFPIYKSLFCKFNLCYYAEISSSFETGYIKPNIEAFKTLKGFSRVLYFGDNIDSDILPLFAMDNVTPVYYCRYQIVNYIVKNGLISLIEDKNDYGIKINRSVLGLLIFLGIISHKGEWISYADLHSDKYYITKMTNIQITPDLFNYLICN